MHPALATVIEVAIVLCLLAAFWRFRSPLTARGANGMAAGALAAAIAIVLVRQPPASAWAPLAAFAAGMAVGCAVAFAVSMIQIPAMVAFQHGAGGVAAFLVSYVELSRGLGSASAVNSVSGFAGLVIGAGTFSASMLAAAKLANILRGRPTRFPAHGLMLMVLIAALVPLCIGAWTSDGWARHAFLTAMVLDAAVTGLLFAVRIGGADMPVLISFLNASAGLAAAFCGVAVQSRLLMAAGATVASSGSVLTHIMCVGMNRSLLNVLWSGNAPQPKPKPAQARPAGQPPAAAIAGSAPAAQPASPLERAAALLRGAKRVVIVPGYGMALANAQGRVAELARRLEKQGKEVLFAIHPVAGRMPGHMNVLLAEAEVDYEKLREMDEINPMLPEVDAVLIVGACDVVNPAAIGAEGTPISGMPIIRVHEARAVVVCNLDDRPGYSGVENPLYDDPRTVMLLGDAAATMSRLADAAGRA